MLSEEAIRIMKERLEVLLEEQKKNLDSAFANGTESSRIIALEIEAEKTEAQIEVISKILEE